MVGASAARRAGIFGPRAIRWCLARRGVRRAADLRQFGRIVRRRTPGRGRGTRRLVRCGHSLGCRHRDRSLARARARGFARCRHRTASVERQARRIHSRGGMDRRCGYLDGVGARRLAIVYEARRGRLARAARASARQVPTPRSHSGPPPAPDSAPMSCSVRTRSSAQGVWTMPSSAGGWPTRAASGGAGFSQSNACSALRPRRSSTSASRRAPARSATRACMSTSGWACDSSLPGSGVVGLDIGRGLRDGEMAVSIGWRR